MVFVLFPKPISSAILVALIIYRLRVFLAMVALIWSGSLSIV